MSSNDIHRRANLMPDAYYARKVRSHLIVDDTGLPLYAADDLVEVIDWCLTDNILSLRLIDTDGKVYARIDISPCSGQLDLMDESEIEDLKQALQSFQPPKRKD